MLVRSLSSTPKKACWSMKLSGSPVTREPYHLRSCCRPQLPSCVRLQPKMQIFLRMVACKASHSKSLVYKSLCEIFVTFIALSLTRDLITSSERFFRSAVGLTPGCSRRRADHDKKSGSGESGKQIIMKSG